MCGDGFEYNDRDWIVISEWDLGLPGPEGAHRTAPADRLKKFLNAKRIELQRKFVSRRPFNDRHGLIYGASVRSVANVWTREMVASWGQGNACS